MQDELRQHDCLQDKNGLWWFYHPGTGEAHGPFANGEAALAVARPACAEYYAKVAAAPTEDTEAYRGVLYYFERGMEHFENVGDWEQATYDKASGDLFTALAVLGSDHEPGTVGWAIRELLQKANELDEPMNMALIDPQ